MARQRRAPVPGMMLVIRRSGQAKDGKRDQIDEWRWSRAGIYLILGEGLVGTGYCRGHHCHIRSLCCNYGLLGGWIPE